MKRLYFYLFIFLIVIVLLGLFLFVYEHKSKQEQFFSVYKLTKEEFDMLRSGDIILRHGYGLVSDMIVKTLNEEFDVSHCAIVLKDTNIKVIHSVSQTLSDFDGVQIQGIKHFVRDSKENSIIVLRYKNTSDSLLQQISQRAMYYLGKKIPFDHAFDLNDSTEFYCTEFLFMVFRDVFKQDLLKDIDPKSKDHLKFDIFWDTNYFDIIINHHHRKSK